MNKMIITAALRKAVSAFNPNEIAEIVSKALISEEGKKNEDTKLLCIKLLSNVTAKVHNFTDDEISEFERIISGKLEEFVVEKAKQA